MQELKVCNKKIEKSDDSIFASPTIMIEVFVMVGNLKTKKAVGIVGFSAEELKTSLPVNLFL